MTPGTPADTELRPVYEVLAACPTCGFFHDESAPIPREPE